MKKAPKPYAPKRGAKFVLGMGTKVVPDRKKEESKKSCRNWRDF